MHVLAPHRIALVLGILSGISLAQRHAISSMRVGLSGFARWALLSILYKTGPSGFVR